MVAESWIIRDGTHTAKRRQVAKASDLHAERNLEAEDQALRLMARHPKIR